MQLQQTLKRQHHIHFRASGHLKLYKQDDRLFRAWLWGNFSLTRQLQRFATNPVCVIHLHTTKRLPSHLERTLLDIKSTQCIYERKIQLLVKAPTPITIHATTIFPTSSLHGKGRQFRYLNNRALGRILFKRRKTITTAIRWIDTPKTSNSTFCKPNTYTRNSLYCWYNLPLIVSEQFEI